MVRRTPTALHLRGRCRAAAPTETASATAAPYRLGLRGCYATARTPWQRCSYPESGSRAYVVTHAQMRLVATLANSTVCRQDIERAARSIPARDKGRASNACTLAFAAHAFSCMPGGTALFSGTASSSHSSSSAASRSRSGLTYTLSSGGRANGDLLDGSKNSFRHGSLVNMA